MATGTETGSEAAGLLLTRTGPSRIVRRHDGRHNGGVMRILFTALVLMLSGTGWAEVTIASPAEVFGHQVGADHKLIPYPKVLDYLQMVADASDRVSIEEAGTSTLGNPMKVVVLTSPTNQANLERLREIARLLAKPGDLSPDESKELVEEGKIIALVTCTIHSTEVGSTQMTTEFVHEFATTEDPEKLQWMEDAVLLMEQASTLDPDNEHYAEQLSRFAGEELAVADEEAVAEVTD